MKTEFDYTLVGDVYIPNLVSTDTNYEIGMWGQRHADYLKQHKKSHYTTLLTTGKLNSYLHDIDIRASKMYDLLVQQLSKKQNITEPLKIENQMLWVQKMNNIANQAREIVNNEIVYKI
ncbi:MAG: TnpV protein [Ruminococcus sp.]|nr:TnpV protein [Ruminococcus sp.]